MIDIFCTNHHLVLDQDQCQICDWVRPAPRSGGDLLWDPVRVPGRLGGPGETVFANLAVHHKTAAFPLQTGEITGIDLRDGRQIWLAPLQEGQHSRDIRPFGEGFLCAVSDLRLPGEAGPAVLARVSTLSGELEEIWTAEQSQISNLSPSADTLVIRTAAPELVVFDRGALPNILWRAPLQSFSTVAPTIAGTRVLVSDEQKTGGEGRLKMFRLRDGEMSVHPFETVSMLPRPLVVVDDLLVFRQGRREIIAIHPLEPEPVWQRKFPRVYTNPAAMPGRLFLAVRHTEPDSGVREYRLVCLHAGSGETLWESKLPGRVRATPAVHQNLVIAATQDGMILAFDAGSGEQIWSCRVAEEPIQTRLAFGENMVIAGTASGILAAVELGIEPVNEDPEDLLASGRPEQAAAAFALAGDMSRAAQIYAHDLRQPEKALALLEHAELFAEAGELAQELELHTLALNYYRSCGDAHAQALVLIRMGDTLQAARVLEEIGELEQAAKLFESSEEYRHALDLYKQLEQPTQVARLSEMVSATDEDIAFLEAMGRFNDAARVAERSGRLRKAADLFHQAQALEEEYRVLQKLVEANPEEWSLERLVELAVNLKDHITAARIWDQLKRPRRAAMAYYEAAVEQEDRQGDAEEIAGLYEQAMVRFADAGLHADRERCFEKVLFYRQLPYIQVHARMKDNFREEELNEAHLEIRNTGHGLAYNVQVEIGGERFEIDLAASSLTIDRLASQTAEVRTVYLRPKARQFGAAVPLSLHWSWSDRLDNLYENQVSTSVSVRRQDESDASRPGEVNLRPVQPARSEVFLESGVISPPFDPREGLIPPTRPVKILFLAANPANTERLMIDAEIRAIRYEIRLTPNRDHIKTEYHGAVQGDDLQSLLLTENPDIVHFSGHGSPSGSIYLEDAFGDSAPVSRAALSDLFRLLKGNIRLVVLNACYSEDQAAGIAEHIDCVIGMENEIGDEAALAFSTAFYRSIGHGTDVEKAFHLGCNAIRIKNPDEPLEPKILADRIDPASMFFFRG